MRKSTLIAMGYLAFSIVFFLSTIVLSRWNWAERHTATNVVVYIMATCGELPSKEEQFQMTLRVFLGQPEIYNIPAKPCTKTLTI